MTANANKGQVCVYCGRAGARIAVDGGQAHGRCAAPERVLAAVRGALNNDITPIDESGQSAGFSAGPLSGQIE
jgi:hypothetical protein